MTCCSSSTCLMPKQPNPLLEIDPASTGRVLCVDLDGTLVYSDTLLESILRLLRRNPGSVFSLFLWLWKGRARLKRKVAERADLNPAELPYNLELIAFLKSEREAGSRIVLATGADEWIAHRIADHLGMFDEVVASDGIINLTGERKKQALISRFGAGGFRYVGNSREDLPVWHSARSAIVCGAGRG